MVRRGNALPEAASPARASSLDWPALDQDAADRGREFRLRRGVPVPMRDGTVLRADVWLPDSGAPWPTLLQRLPYDKGSSFMTQHIVGLEAHRAAERGFAVVIQDTRGRFTSEGDFAPFVHEADDGVDTIQWIRRQEFSDGDVAMYGASYIGATQMLAASQAPRGLRAIAPHLTSADYYEGWTYTGGALQLGFLLLWVMESLAGPDVQRLRSGPVRDAAEQLLGELLTDPEAAFAQLPVDSDVIASLAPYFREWLAHPVPDDFWSAVRPADAFGAMDVAALHIAGWNDLFLESGLRSYRAMRTSTATAWAREHQHLVVGPWSHGNPGDWQGDEWLGHSANAAAVDLTALHLAFFESVLSGKKPSLPRVRIFTTGANTWRDEDDWPLARARDEVLFLRTGRALSAAPPSAPEAADTWVADPADPVPTVGGATFLPGLLVATNSGHREQRAVELRPDVVVYTGPTLERDVEVTGEVQVELHASSSATDCDWTARLVDVHPDGTTRGVVDGILRARYRHGLDRPQPLVPHEAEAFRFPLGSISHLFRAGHSIRLQLASSNFPRFDRNPQQMVPVAGAGVADLRTAHQTVFHEPGRASCLVLPVVHTGSQART